MCNCFLPWANRVQKRQQWRKEKGHGSAELHCDLSSQPDQMTRQFDSHKRHGGGTSKSVFFANYLSWQLLVSEVDHKTSPARRPKTDLFLKRHIFLLETWGRCGKIYCKRPFIKLFPYNIHQKHGLVWTDRPHTVKAAYCLLQTGGLFLDLANNTEKKGKCFSFYVLWNNIKSCFYFHFLKLLVVCFKATLK